MKPFIDHYELLDLEPTATKVQIKSAYRRAIQESHPDKHESAEHVEERARALNEAKRVLLDPTLRRAFDLERLRRNAARPNASRPTSPNPGTSPIHRPSTASRTQHGYATQVTGTVTTPTTSSGGLWAVLGLGLLAGGWVVAAANSYDPVADRYRSRDGRFRRSRFS